MVIGAYGEKQEFLAIKENISKFNNLNNSSFKITFYENKKLFLKEIKEKNIDFVFLINSPNFPKLFDFATEIKKQLPNIKIVFCCYSNEYAVVGYKINLSYYLLLPINYEEFEFCIKKCTFINDENIIINWNWQKICIPYKNIHFVEKQGHNVIIHTTKQNFHTRITFKKFLNNFKNKENFNHCIRGTIVNFDWVSEIKLQNFLMKNGEKISIRRKDRKYVKELFFNYKLKKNIFQ